MCRINVSSCKHPVVCIAKLEGEREVIRNAMSRIMMDVFVIKLKDDGKSKAVTGFQSILIVLWPVQIKMEGTSYFFIYILRKSQYIEKLPIIMMMTMMIGVQLMVHLQTWISARNVCVCGGIYIYCTLKFTSNFL